MEALAFSEPWCITLADGYEENLDTKTYVVIEGREMLYPLKDSDQARDASMVKSVCCSFKGLSLVLCSVHSCY